MHDGATSARVTSLFERCLSFAPCIMLLKNVDKLCLADQESIMTISALFLAAQRGCAKGSQREGRRTEKR